MIILADYFSRSAHFYFVTPKDKLKTWYVLWGVEGVEKVIPRELAWFWHLDHLRAGDLVFLEEGYSAVPYMMGTHGFQELTDVRIPVIMAGAGIKVGARIIDIVPTACFDVCYDLHWSGKMQRQRSPRAML